jgi:adenosine deaminase
MEKAGLRITLNSDDPPMFHTDIGEEFARMVPAAGWDAARVRNLCLTAVDASWTEPDEQRAMRRQIEQELDELDAERAGAA